MTNNFDLRKFLTENSLTKTARVIKEERANYNTLLKPTKFQVIYSDYSDEDVPYKEIFNTESEAEDFIDSHYSDDLGSDIRINSNGDDEWFTKTGVFNPEENEYFPSARVEPVNESREKYLTRIVENALGITPTPVAEEANEEKVMKNLEKVLKRLENEITFYTNETKNKNHDSAVIDRMKAKISVLEDMVVYVERLIKEEETVNESREDYLTRLVENALGITPAPVAEESNDEMVEENPLPKYKNIDELMKNIEYGTNEAAHKYKMNRMKEIADALEAKVTSLEEGENAEHIDQKAVKTMKKDIMTLRKGVEKLEKEYEKKFAKKEKKEDK